MKATQTEIEQAKAAGLSERGLEALRTNDRNTYKQELDKLPDSLIWKSWTGYNIWFRAASASERARDLRLIESELARVK